MPKLSKESKKIHVIFRSCRNYTYVLVLVQANTEFSQTLFPYRIDLQIRDAPNTTEPFTSSH